MTDNFNELLSSLEQKLTNDCTVLQKTVKSIIDAVKKEKENNDNIVKSLKKFEPIESDIVKLNIGGSLFSTFKSTLTKQLTDKNGNLYSPNLFVSFLNGFAKPKYDENNAIFIDRNPKYFGHLLDFLRIANSNLEYEVPGDLDRNELIKEAKYYNVKALEDFLNIEDIKISLKNFDSTILSKNKFDELMKFCEFPKNTKWTLLYRASRDGFGSNDFHSKCDAKPNNLVIVKSSQGYIFGGYTSEYWDTSDKFISDEKAFLFTFVNSLEYPMKLSINQNFKNKAIYCSDKVCPTFGSGFDLCIANNSNTSKQSYTKLGNTYSIPSSFCDLYGHNPNNSNINSLFAGTQYFQTVEIEVFHKM